MCYVPFTRICQWVCFFFFTFSNALEWGYAGNLNDQIQNLLKFDQRFRASGLNNWEYPRFSPPRPRSLKLNANPVADNKGHLLPTARRDGNSFGNYRGTYELPLRITRSFCARYDACLSGRYKFRDFPRDLCSCQRENTRARACDNRETLGIKGDPFWDRPKCPPKCEAIHQLLKLNENYERCRRIKCIIKQEDQSEKKDKRDVSMPKSKGENAKKERNRLRHRKITAFPKTRKILPGNDSSNSKVGKSKVKSQGANKSNTKLTPKKTESKSKKETARNSGNSTHKRKSSKTSQKEKGHNKDKQKHTSGGVEKTAIEKPLQQEIPQEL